MQSGQISIFNLFDGTKYFQIPTYQRAYAWGEKQLAEFTADFEDQVKEKNYFFGTILFREADKEDIFEVIEIVDGQQRITTLMIYIKLLLKRLEENGEKIDLFSNAYLNYGGRYKLKVQPEDNVFFEAYILNDFNGSKMIETPSQHRLWYARNFLEKKVSEYSLTQVKEIRQKIDSTQVLIYSVQDKSEATLIFEVTNDRGKPLTNLEKTKSFLMHKTYLACKDPEPPLETIQQSFISIYQDLEPILDIQKSVNEDSILQYHFIAFEKWWSNNSFKQYADYVGRTKTRINSYFSKRDFSRTITEIQNYTRELRESYKIMKDLILDPKNNRILDLIALERVAVFYPLLIKICKYDTSQTKDNIKKVTRLMEIISFRVWGIRRRRSDTGRETLYALARDFDGEFSDLISKLKSFIERNANETEFREKLLSQNLYQSINLNDLRYLYWKYENYLRQKEKPYFGEMGYEELRSFDPRTRFTIEHIAPQNPENKNVIIDNKIIPEITKEFQEKWLHSLGNLTIDPASANFAKQNFEMATKNNKFFRKAPLKTQNELIDFIELSNPQWNEIAIQKRRDKISNFALEYWDYKNI